MKELTMDEKKGLLAEVNKLLATIPDYQMAMPVIEMENNDIFILNLFLLYFIFLRYRTIYLEESVTIFTSLSPGLNNKPQHSLASALYFTACNLPQSILSVD